MIITLTGANDFARRSRLTALVSAFEAQHGAIAIERYDGEEVPVARMHEAAQGISFLSPHKLVVLREPGKQKEFADTVEIFLQNIADTTTVILEEPKLDKRLTYYKTLKKHTDFTEYPQLDVSGLSVWVNEYLQAHSATASRTDIALLISRVGLNQQMLKSELDKLIAYDPVVTTDTILLLTELLPQSTIFELLDAAFKGNTEQTFRLYTEQRALKVEPQAILAMIAWQLHALALVKAGEGRSIEDIAKESRLNPFVARKTQAIARKLDLLHLRVLITQLLQLDMQLKRSAINADEALQLFLLKLSQK